MDNLSPEKRSWNMSRIKNRDTQPEKVVRSLLHRMGYRFRLHRKDLPGKPDIVLPKYKTIILVHGCYWHRHEDCRYAYTPKSNVKFWNQKFDANIKHDKKVKKTLQNSGWKVHIIWECETKSEDKLVNIIKEIMTVTDS